MRYKHFLIIELDTQFPENDRFPDMIKDMLGPWCSKVTPTRLNKEYDPKKDT